MPGGERGSTGTVMPYTPQLLQSEVTNILQSSQNIIQSYEKGDWKEPNNKQLEAAFQFAKQVVNLYGQHKNDLNIQMPTSIKFTSPGSGGGGSSNH